MSTAGQLVPFRTNPRTSASKGLESGIHVVSYWRNSDIGICFHYPKIKCVFFGTCRIVCNHLFKVKVLNLSCYRIYIRLNSVPETYIIQHLRQDFIFHNKTKPKRNQNRNENTRTLNLRYLSTQNKNHSHIHFNIVITNLLFVLYIPISATVSATFLFDEFPEVAPRF